MILVERYIFRTACVAFLAVCLALTAVIWVTQALRELDLMTGQGQSVLVFITFNLRSLPTLRWLLLAGLTVLATNLVLDLTYRRFDPRYVGAQVRA